MNVTFVSPTIPLGRRRPSPWHKCLLDVSRSGRTVRHSCRLSVMELEVGKKVRVKESIIMYHYPKQKGSPFDVKGLEGEITKNILEDDGADLSATKPLIVRFENPKFMAHFEESELEELQDD